MAFCCLNFTIMVFVELLWFCFWENSGTQFVNIGDTESSYDALSLEYHKGKPLVYFYFIRYMLSFRIFADDTNVLYKG